MRKRWIIFAETYLKTWNATKSAVEAGYSARSAHAQGHRLLKNAEISEYIQGRIDELIPDTDEIIISLADLARTATSVNARIRAWELLAKAGGLFTEKIQIESEIRVVVEYDEDVEGQGEETNPSPTEDTEEPIEAEGAEVGAEVREDDLRQP